jgi:hypothetical protein
MRKNKKGSLELGVNSIVILIIAMAVLGLIIYFIYKNLQPDIPPLPVQPAMAPDSSNPITTSPPELAGKSGEKIQARINVYNPSSTSAYTLTKLSIKCKEVITPVTINEQLITSLDYKEFTTIFAFPKLAKDKHLCQFIATGNNSAEADVDFATKDVVIEIK